MLYCPEITGSQMPSTKKLRPAALDPILAFQFSFPQLITQSEAFFELDDCADGTGPLIDTCFTLSSRLADLKEHAESFEEEGEAYTLPFAKETWLDMIVTLCGIITRRVNKGEQLFESEAANAKLREELGSLRAFLIGIYSTKTLAKLEAMERLDLE
jgi:hypothetical protein